MDQASFDTRIIDLLIYWEECRARGRTLSPLELAGDSPELATELDRRIAVLRALEAVIALDLSLRSDRAADSPPGRGPIEPRSLPAGGFTTVARLVEPRFHAQGGLGEIMVVSQEELGRPVALKRIRPDQLRDATRRRFLREAAITARLQHPGIVPIHGIGEDADGPFYTMPFIEGETLEEAIGRFHEPGAAPRDPVGRDRAFRDLLRHFITLCETIAYAHGQGVVHRDLKPSNVMLGPYGETMVLDWGLAKPFGGDPADAETAAGPKTETESDERSPSPEAMTATGTVLGTPRYMSPEQAAGRPAGPPSDVYSLGVILYTILIGRSPYDPSPAADPLRPVREAAVVPPRRRDPAISRALEAVCLRALGARPEDRYDSPAALAEDLTRWLDDQPVSAWHEPRSIRARRWMRRHPGTVAGVLAAVLMGVLASLSLTAVIIHSDRTIRRQDNQITLRNRELLKANEDLVRARADAEAQRDQARAVIEFLVSSFRRPDPAEDGRKVTVAEVLGGAVKDLERRAIQPATQARFLNAVGETYRGLGLVSEALEVWEKAHAIRRRALGDDHPDTLESANNLALALSEAGQLERAIPLYEQTLESRRARLGEDHLDTLTTMNDLAIAYEDTGQLKRAMPLYQQVLRLRERKQGADHRETLISMNNLGSAYRETGDLARAIPLLERALRGQQAQLSQDHPETLNTMNNLALAYRESGRLKDALALHRQEYGACRGRLGEDHRETLISMNNLARAYQEFGDLDQAIALYEQALRLKRIQLDADHPSVLITVRNLAAAHEKAQHHPEAERLYRQVVEASGRRKPRDDPFYSDSLGRLGRMLNRRGRAGEAVPLLRECLEIKEKAQPDDWSTALARALLGDALAGQKAYADAEKLLLAGYSGLVERGDRLPMDRDRILHEAVDALIRLYRAWDKPAEAERWTKRRPSAPPVRPPASPGSKPSERPEGQDSPPASGGATAGIKPGP